MRGVLTGAGMALPNVHGGIQGYHDILTNRQLLRQNDQTYQMNQQVMQQNEIILENLRRQQEIDIFNEAERRRIMAATANAPRMPGGSPAPSFTPGLTMPERRDPITPTPAATPAAAPAVPAAAAPPPTGDTVLGAAPTAASTPTMDTVRAQLFDVIQRIESSDQPDAVSPVGAVGLMQIMPETAKRPGYNTPSIFELADVLGIEYADRSDSSVQQLLRNPTLNREFGEIYFSNLLDSYNYNLGHAIAAYNWGPGNTNRWIQNGANFNELPQETQNYITKLRSEFGYELDPYLNPDSFGGAGPLGAASTSETPTGLPETATVAGTPILDVIFPSAQAATEEDKAGEPRAPLNLFPSTRERLSTAAEARQQLWDQGQYGAAIGHALRGGVSGLVGVVDDVTRFPARGLKRGAVELTDVGYTALTGQTRRPASSTDPDPGEPDPGEPDTDEPGEPGTAEPDVVEQLIDAEDFYRADMDRLSADTQFVLQNRTQLQEWADYFRNIGTPEAIMQYQMLAFEIANSDNALYNAMGMQGISELQKSRDPRRLSAVWSHYAGQDIQIIPVRDGTFNIEVNGVTRMTSVPESEVIEMAQLTFSSAARDQLAANRSAMFDLQIELQKIHATEAAKAQFAAPGVTETMDGTFVTSPGGLFQYNKPVDGRPGRFWQSPETSLPASISPIRVAPQGLPAPGTPPVDLDLIPGTDWWRDWRAQ